MFQSFIITLREGIEAALIIGIVFGHLRKTGRENWSRIVYWGLGAAVAASLVGAYVLNRVAIREDVYEGWLMLAGALFVATMAIWMWRTGKRLKDQIETQLSRLSAQTPRGAAFGLFAFVFLMVLREGIETVLFLAAVSLHTSALLDFIGGLLGLGLAIGLGVALFKGSLKVNLRKFFAVTTLVLLIIAAQLLVSGVHELSEAGILPSGPREMAWVGPIVNNQAFFFIVVVALALFLVAAQRSGATEAALVANRLLSAPARRKALAEWRRERFWKTISVAAGVVIIVAISAEFIYSRTAQAVSPPEEVSVENGLARIPVSRLQDHRLHHFAVNVPGTTVRLIAILDATDSVRAGLDACLICGHQGYYQDGTNVICRNCAAAVYVPTIGVAGGCNPIHIDYQVEDDSLIIAESALAHATQYFQ
ncbi:MAG: Fe-S-containing protein [Acidobacteriia bacterium]|nr:Fe-S-containing protein [Terriglobia bacterium]